MNNTLYSKNYTYSSFFHRSLMRDKQMMILITKEKQTHFIIATSHTNFYRKNTDKFILQLCIIVLTKGKDIALNCFASQSL